MKPWTLLALLAIGSAWCGGSDAAVEGATGPLRVHPGNPLYFANANGKAVYLAGHQIFVDLQDRSWARTNMPNGSQELDWNWYLDFAQAHHFNYLRNWTLWSSSPTFWDAEGDSSPTAGNRRTHPMPYLRTGPGLALDGRPKFNLDRWDEAFWTRLRRRVGEAQRRGIYVSVMLFELYGFLANDQTYPKSLWAGNIFHGPNNSAGLEADSNEDRNGFEFFTLADPSIARHQKAYVKKMVETLKSYDNVMWEICNEPPNTPETQAWLKEMVRYVKACESKQSTRHLVLMTPGGSLPGGEWNSTSKEDVLGIGADCYAVGGAWGGYTSGDPPLARTISATQPGIVDRDHVSATDASASSATMPWEALIRGYGGYSLYDHPFERPEEESPAWELARRNIGATRAYTERLADLSRMRAQGELSSSGFCLANPDLEYLVFLPKGGSAVVDLAAASGSVAAEWFSPTSCQATSVPTVQGGAKREFTASFEGPAVLYLTGGARGR